MNSEKQNGEKPQPTADDPWAPVTVSADEPTTYGDRMAVYQGELTTYERGLESAGYGDSQRQRYIEGSGEDPEYAACQWDEMIVPAAEAAGIIPTRPSEPVSPAEEARAAARAEYWQQHPDDGWDPWDNDPAKEAEFKTFVDSRTEQLLQEARPEPTEREQAAPDPDDDFDVDM
ncbi:hypothetical protein ACIRO1_45250 [Streptomyces sp. NPDC102381]|uniref:hypothetical protein n=1 Tax=Streptomyces sp. NPDC102381 TaxID=3366164 RepID=UPI0038180602